MKSVYETEQMHNHDLRLTVDTYLLEYPFRFDQQAGQMDPVLLRSRGTCHGHCESEKRHESEEELR